MIRFALLAIALGGCNAVFDLGEPTGRDAGPDASPDASPDAGPSMVGTVGAVSVDYVNATGGVTLYVLGAMLGPPSSTCVVLSQVGSCVTATCSTAPPMPRPDAGAITFAALVSPTLIPDPDGNYPTAVQTQAKLFDEGDALHVSAAGGEVPAFTTTLTTPAAVTFSTPMPSPTAQVVYPRMAPIAMAWTGGGIGNLGVSITSNGSTTVINCLFAASAGAGVIDQALIAQLPAGPGQLNTIVTTEAAVVAGDFGVRVTASVIGKRFDGDRAFGAIDLQ